MKSWLRTIVIAGVTVLLATSCSMKKGSVTGTSGGGSLNGGGGGSAIPTDFSKTSIVNGSQLPARLAVITGVQSWQTVTNNTLNINLATADNNFRAAYSPTGNPNGFSTQMSLALISTVSQWCQAAGLREAALADAQRVMYPGVVTSVAMPAGGFSDAQLQKLIQVAWSRFRGEDVVPSDVAANLLQAMKDVYTSLPATATDNTRNASKANALGARAVAESACIIVGASMGSLASM